MAKKTYTAKEAEKINKILEALGMMEITKGGVKPIKAGDIKKTVKKKTGQRVFAPKETGVTGPKSRPKKPKEPKKPNKKIFAPKETGTIQDLYDQGLIFDRDKKSKGKVNKKAGQRVGTANYPGKKKVQPTPEELKGMKKKTAKKKNGGKTGSKSGGYKIKTVVPIVTVNKGPRKGKVVGTSTKITTHNRLY